MDDDLALNGTDITNLPIVSVVSDTNVFAEDGGSASITISLSEPAPVGGLQLNVEVFDTDGEAGDLELSTENIVDIFVDESSNTPTSITVAEGATEAVVTLTGIPDNELEGEETDTFNLLPGDGFTVDPLLNSVTTIITDLPIDTFGEDIFSMRALGIGFDDPTIPIGDFG